MAVCVGVAGGGRSMVSAEGDTGVMLGRAAGSRLEGQQLGTCK